MSELVKEQNKYKTYIKASYFKRFAAFLMDFVLIIVGFILVSTIANSIISNIPMYKEAKVGYQEVALESHLFESKDGFVDLVSEDIDEALTLFYQDYDDKNDLQDSYTKIKSNSVLFSLNDDGDLVEVGTKEKMDAFYELELYKAYELFLAQEEVYQYTNISNSFSLIGMSVSALIPVTIIWLVIPLILKDGASLGKKMVGLSYVSIKSPGNKVTKAAIILNFFAFAVVCLLLSFFLLGIPLLINMIFICVNKYGFGFADYYTGMVLVDKNRFYSSNQTVKEITIERIPSKDGKDDILDELA